MKLLLGAALLTATSIAFAGQYGANGAFKPGYGGVTGKVVPQRPVIEDNYKRADQNTPFRSNPRDQYFDTTTAANQELIRQNDIQRRVNNLLDNYKRKDRKHIENLIGQMTDPVAREHAQVLLYSRTGERRSR